MQDTRLDEIARKHGFSVEAAREALRALQSGSGMAQFSHPELGGYGQWMSGMIMIGDMFNSSLRARVDGLFAELAGVAHTMREAPRDSGSPAGDDRRGGSGNWWPEDLGWPSSTGAQGGMRYAYFPSTARLVIEDGGRTTLYDTGRHQISGVSQQQGGGRGGAVFTSQLGTVALDSLGIVERR